VIALLLCAAPALAVDGVREINAVCAVNTGCFGGDAAGYPVTITTPGSYRLTGNLVFTDANTDAIVVSSDYVQLDLNGFAITGITQCLPACSPTGSGRGIFASETVFGLVVRNGTVSQMGNTGVSAGIHSRIEDMVVVSNGGFGVFANANSSVLRCTVSRSGNGGIVVSSGTLVADNAVSFTRGIEAGILTGSGSVVRGNSVYAGTADGISVSNGSVVTGNSVSANDGDGIQSDGQSRFIGNSAFNNDGYGLRLVGTTDGYSDNTIVELGPGTLTVFQGLNLGGNQCNASSVCP
jgi:hypothetical protein